MSMRTALRRLEVKGRILRQQVKALAEEDDGVWRTVNERRIFIGKGESVADAMKGSLRDEAYGRLRAQDKKERVAERSANTKRLHDYLRGKREPPGSWERKRNVFVGLLEKATITNGLLLKVFPNGTDKILGTVKKVGVRWRAAAEGFLVTEATGGTPEEAVKSLVSKIRKISPPPSLA